MEYREKLALGGVGARRGQSEISEGLVWGKE